MKRGRIDGYYLFKNFIRNLYENLSQNYQMGGVIHMFILVECCDRNMELLGVHDKKTEAFLYKGGVLTNLVNTDFLRDFPDSPVVLTGTPV